MNFILENVDDLDYLGIVSGDKDFIRLIRKFIRKSAKIVRVCSDLKSLSTELIHLTDSNEKDRKLIYLFKEYK